MDLLSLIPGLISATAIGVSAYWSRRTSLEVANITRALTTDLKRNEVTQTIIQSWFGPEMTKIKRVAHETILRMREPSAPERDDVVDLLVNWPLDQRKFLPATDSSDIRPSQAITVVLYYWVQLVTYKDLNMIDEAVVRRVFISMWEFWEPELRLVADLYQERTKAVRLQFAEPPWIRALTELHEWMKRR